MAAPLIEPILADAVEIARALSLLIEPGSVTELRVPETTQGTISGYYDEMEALVRDAELWNGKGPAVYVLPQPVLPDLLARACNRFKNYVKHTTTDKQVLRRRWLLLDCDAVRPADISSTDAEWDAANRRADDLAGWLEGRGFCGVGRGDSGNGGHVIGRIDLPNDADSTALIERCLAALKSRFDDAAVTIDPSTGNAARMWKLYGTVASKGDAIPTRPHRVSRLLILPDAAAVNPRDLLEALAATLPAPVVSVPATNGKKVRNGKAATTTAEARGDYATLDVVAWFTAHGHYGRALGSGKHAVQCPWESEHTTRRRPEDSDTTVWEAENGAWPQFHCLHAHCAGRTITDVLDIWNDAERHCASHLTPNVWPVESGGKAASEPPGPPPPVPTSNIASLNPMWIIDSDPPRYEVTINGEVITLSHAEAMEFRAFKSACIKRLRFLPFLPFKTNRNGKEMTPQTVWERFVFGPALEEARESGRIKPAPADAGDFGAAWESVLLFFRQMRSTESREDLLHDKLVREEDTFLFRGRTLRTWLAKHRLDTLKASDLWNVIYQHGGQPKNVRAGKRVVSVWVVPAEVTEDARSGDED